MVPKQQHIVKPPTTVSAIHQGFSSGLVKVQSPSSNFIPGVPAQSEIVRLGETVETKISPGGHLLQHHNRVKSTNINTINRQFTDERHRAVEGVRLGEATRTITERGRVEPSKIQ